MKTHTLIFLLLLTSFGLFGQDCNCLKNMTFLEQKIEDNQASYQHQVVEQNRLIEYTNFKTEVNRRATTLVKKKDCIGLVAYYLSFFRDEHSFIFYTQNYIPEPNEVIKAKSKRNNQRANFEGLWFFEDGSFSIRIIEHQTNLGQWVAVMEKDHSKLWKMGQLKIEFFKDQNENMQCIYWRQNLIPKKHSVSFTDSILSIGRNLKFFRTNQENRDFDSNGVNDLLYDSLSEQTNYLKIPSFDLSYKSRIDSLINVHRTEITSKKNLIIDVRNNGGGGFDAFESLLPFIMDTQVIESPYEGSVWVSKDNFNYYDSTKYEYTESRQDSLDELNYVRFLEESMGHFTPVETSSTTISLVAGYPLNVAVLCNRNSASSTEGFVLQINSSKKVKTFGENTAGAVSYGDWMPIEIPELNIWVAVTTKKMIFKNSEDFESIGITPDFDLTNMPENEWLKFVVEYLEK